MVLPDSLAGVVRAMLLTLDDPNEPDIDRLTTLVRARWTQAGKPLAQLTRDRIATEFYKIRSKLGGTVTKASLSAYHDGSAPNGKATKPKPTMRNPSTNEPMLGADRLRAGKAFVSTCGGFASANAVLALLKELVES